MIDKRLIILALALALSCAFFMFSGLTTTSSFILTLRGEKLVSLVVVGAATGMATIIFQTATANRILTPSIMGFDALFLLIQTALIFLLGGLAYAHLPSTPKFILETAVMMIAAMGLFSVLLGRGRRDMHRMILVGVITGILFRSLTIFFQRMLDPAEFGVVQGAMFASFGSVDPNKLLIATLICAVVFVAIAFLTRTLDIIALGRIPAIGLGLNYDLLILVLLALTAALIAITTALVGPISFLGLLVAALAHSLMRTHKHALLLPASAMIGALILVLGQAMFERVFHLESSLAIIVEFVGGVIFLLLVIRGSVR